MWLFASDMCISCCMESVDVYYKVYSDSRTFKFIVSCWILVPTPCGCKHHLVLIWYVAVQDWVFYFIPCGLNHEHMQYFSPLFIVWPSLIAIFSIHFKYGSSFGLQVMCQSISEFGILFETYLACVQSAIKNESTLDLC